MAAKTPFTDIAGRGVRKAGMRPWLLGLIAVAVIVVGAFFAYTKANPFSSPYELNAVFESANEIKPNAPVRIAGVEVGKVKTVESMEDGSGFAEVTMEINEDGLPVKEDARLTIRSRLFLEGNYFVDLHPGSPSEDELDSGSTIGPQQTAYPVQFGQVLSALQSNTREDLRDFLKEYSKATSSKNFRGARGFNEAIEHWEEAYRTTSQVNDATLGEEEHDLQRVLNGQGKVFGALSRDERALRDLVTHLNAVAGALAREEDALSATIPQLRDVLRVGRPALRSLNEGLPSLRRFARDGLPAMQSTDRTLDVQIPFIRQARALMSRAELRGLTRDLRPTIPALARLNRGNVRLFEQTRSLSACQNNVLVPFAKTPIPDPDFPQNSGEPWFEQSGRVFVGLSGESRLADANSPFFRIQGGGGPTTLVNSGESGEEFFAQALFPVEGVRPAAPTRRPEFRPDVPCELQEPPDLNAAPGEGDQEVRATPDPLPRFERRERRAQEEFEEVVKHVQREARGLPTIDPLSFSPLGMRLQARRLGLVKDKNGNWVEKKDREGGE